MNAYPSKLTTPDLRDECLDGAQCLFDAELHDGPDPADRIEHPDARAAREAVAKDVCATCPVQLTCLEHAIRTRPASGVWAGLTAEELAQLTAQRAVREQLADVYEGVA